MIRAFSRMPPKGNSEGQENTHYKHIKMNADEVITNRRFVVAFLIKLSLREHVLKYKYLQNFMPAHAVTAYSGSIFRVITSAVQPHNTRARVQTLASLQI